MNKQLFTFFVFIVIGVNLTFSQSAQSISVLGIRDSLQGKYSNLGVIKFTDNGFNSHCNFFEVINDLKKQATFLGGNTIKLNEIKTPTVLGSTCFRMTACVLTCEKTQIKPSKLDSNCALIHVACFKGSYVDFDLRLGDSIICTVRDNWRKTIKITNEGPNYLWIKGFKGNISVDIQKGTEYYVYCSNLIEYNAQTYKAEFVGKELGQIIYNAISMDESKFSDVIITTKQKEIICFIESESNESISYLTYNKKAEPTLHIINKSEINKITNLNALNSFQSVE